MATPRTAEPLKVYWQPGCSSCLKTKEFLTRNGIEYESVNVRAVPEALDRLSALGARSIPVIVRGTDWTYGQDLDDVAQFIGVGIDRPRLGLEALELRLERLLAAATRFTVRLPEPSLETLLPGRADRAGADLAWHIPMIVAGFLAAARGEALTFDYFERRPTAAERNRAAIIAMQEKIARDFDDWRHGAAGKLPKAVETYYGRRSIESVVERTAWHVAQHVRQLESLLRDRGEPVECPLTEAELGGLPLPEGIWDPEIGQIARS
jgi:glutaredoxin